MSSRRERGWSVAKSQQVIIKIGYLQFMLPDDTGAATVVKTLSRAIQVHHYSGAVQLLKEETPDVSLSYLSAGTKFTDENDRPIAIPRPRPKGVKALPANRHLQLGWEDPR